ncbi:MAG: Re/Si-specific NAD(P)(+) transhydrogenase subunit alpha [Coxiellaceae bacterium]|jgi:NAD(P) transhydrogenase subunit alpha|nr:Re/Si-specific NAD(P)(+) transhydrogenase subunit alpha [Coxiellaceae bacterium]
MLLTIAIPKETTWGESRIAITPNLITKLSKLGVTIKIQSGAGIKIHAQDASYKNTTFVQNITALYANSDIILKVQPPTVEEVDYMKEKTILISFLYPHLNPNTVKKLLDKEITSFAMEFIPRISRAQDMDALSSQATIIGYKAVLIAADNSKFFFPMLTTAAGSIRPAKVFIIGVGVAGLQAIATAKRLGAQVSAYDIRLETKEQSESLGAKFIDTGVQAIGAGGYARELTQLEKEQQTEILKKHIATCDVIITTTGIPGKPAPKILTKEMVKIMKPGSIVVDTLADMGGNCELTKPGETTIYNDVTIIGPLNIPSSMAIHASEMYARNLINLLSLIIKDQILNPDWNDEIIASSVVTHEGVIKNPIVQKLLEGKL